MAARMGQKGVRRTCRRVGLGGALLAELSPARIHVVPEALVLVLE